MINIEEHLSTLLEKANSEYMAITSKIRLKAVKEVACTSEVYSFLPYELKRQEEEAGIVKAGGLCIYGLDINRNPVFYIDHHNQKVEYYFDKVEKYVIRYTYQFYKSGPTILNVAALLEIDGKAISSIIKGISGTVYENYERKGYRINKIDVNNITNFGTKASQEWVINRYSSGVVSSLSIEGYRSPAYEVKISNKFNDELLKLRISLKESILEVLKNDNLLNSNIYAVVYGLNKEKVLPPYLARRQKEISKDDVEVESDEDFFDVIWNPADFPEYASDSLDLRTLSVLAQSTTVMKIAKNKDLILIHELLADLLHEISSEVRHFSWYLIDDEAVNLI